jgi:hypothetical protein
MKTNRREFFRKAVQLTLFSAMIGGTAFLLKKNRIQLEGCADNQFCRKCQELSTCSLDQAKNFRKDERQDGI